MRSFGILLIAIGVAYLFIAFNMDVSVSTSSTYIPGYGSVGGGDVANLDLMARRQNHLIVAALITLIGVLLATFGGTAATAEADRSPLKAAVVTPFEGQRDLSSDPYRLWLAKTYAIVRNDVFDRFVIQDQTFASLDEALAHAHTHEQQKIDATAAEAERKREQAEERLEAATIQREFEDAEWAKLKPKLIIGVILLVVAIALAFFLLRETPEERKVRLAKEEAERIELVASFEKRFDIGLPKDAKNLKITENAADQSYLCNGASDGTLLTFSTGLTKEGTKDHLAKSLGAGSPEYGGSVPNNFDWKWTKKSRRVDLSMLSERQPIEVDLCITGAS